jgi:A/G-specific adenine glycosylase
MGNGQIEHVYRLTGLEANDATGYTDAVEHSAADGGGATGRALPNRNPERQHADFARLLLAWYAHNRRDLPWRRTADPYAVWISEMMLQQTQVATVIPYWTRWMERFPTIDALASASLDAVLESWQGLGYYARARNLHRAARVIVEQHGGRFPTHLADVLALPGIGRYTAGAVCSIALGQDVPIVDANVVRVLCRVFGIHGNPKSATVQNRLWELALSHLPAGHSGEFNQAMMELGALVCEPSPRCGVCPLREVCHSFASGDPGALPEFAPKPAFTRQIDVSTILLHPDDSGRILLVRRPDEGLWGGLWESPRVTLMEGAESVPTAAERAARECAGVAALATGEIAATVKHGVTTRRITLIGVVCRLLDDPELKSGAGGGPTIVRAWAAPAELGVKYPLSSPQSRLLNQATDPGPQLRLL